MARQMVINYGMSDIGPWSLLDPSAQSGDVIMRMMARNSMSENLQLKIDDAVKKIAEEAYATALKHISENRDAMDRIVEVVVEKVSRNFVVLSLEENISFLILLCKCKYRNFAIVGGGGDFTLPLVKSVGGSQLFCWKKIRWKACWNIVVARTFLTF